MTKQQTIQEACGIIALAYSTIGDYTHSSDCFCGLALSNPTYNNGGEALRYVRNALIKQLKADGYKVKEQES